MEIMNGGDNHTGQGKPSERQLEEILQDPNAKWSDIRNAMKARGPSACTNAALIRAISGGIDSPEVKIASHCNKNCTSNEQRKTSLPPVSSECAVPTNAVDNAADNCAPAAIGDEKQSSSDNAGEYEQYLVPTHQGPVAGTRRPRRQSRKLSAVKTSVNMMDFGVDNFAELDEEEESAGSVVSNCTCDSQGFLGWKRNASVDSNLSALCDADGFLTWELTASARAKRALPSSRRGSLKGSMTSDSSNLSRQCDADGFLAWEMSASIRAAKALDAEKIAKAIEGHDVNPEDDEATKLWRIEDYEGCSSDNDCVKSSQQHKKPMSFLSSRCSTVESYFSDSFWKGSADTNPTKASCSSAAAENNASDLDEVKQALMKRCSRKSVDEGTTKPLSEARDKPNLLKHLHQFHSTHSVQQEVSESTNATDYDTREAIWINKTDGGGVDIEKECRKLYLESGNQEEKNSSRVVKYIRRASLLGREPV